MSASGPSCPRPPGRRRVGCARFGALLALGAALVAACGAGPERPGAGTEPALQSWDGVLRAAAGQQVSLWMWGGDPRGNAYVDDVLAPAAAERGVELRRVPVADTQDALNRVLSELQAGVTDDGSVDLVWVNGENFRSGQQARAWRCGWTDLLPNMRFVDPRDPLVASDFGTPVRGCESPWHKAQFALAYDADDVEDPPTSMLELFAWAERHPGRFTYPAPPDFTGSAFLRQALYAVSGGPERVPDHYHADTADSLTDPLWARLRSLEPSLWRGGATYPRSLTQLEELYAGDQVSFTMTYGPATLEELVRSGDLPRSTRVLTLEEGTLGNASFLAIPANAGDAAGAMVVADLALSPRQQLAKARPRIWGQYTVLDPERVPEAVAARFRALPRGTVVPPFEELSRDADPEPAADWVAPLEEGWRTRVLAPS